MSSIPLGPSIADASQTDALFQTDDAIIDGLRRRQKKEKQLGDPIEISSKILCMSLAPSVIYKNIHNNSKKNDSRSDDDDGVYAYLGNSNHTARKVNLVTGSTVKVYKGHTGPVTSVAAFYRYVEKESGNKEKQELLLSGSWDKTLCLWDAQTKEALLTMRGHSDFVKAIAIGKDHLVDGATRKDGHPTTAYSVSADGTARRWSLTTGACLAVYENKHRGQIESVAVTIGPNPTLGEETSSTDATASNTIREWLWTAGTDGTIRCWDVDTAKCIVTLTGHETSIYDLHVPTNDGYGGDLWTASADKSVRRWDLETCSEDANIEHPQSVRSVSIVGPYVATGCRDEDVRVFDVASGQLVAILEGHFDEIMSIVAHNGVLYTASLDATIRRWSMTDIAAGKYILKSGDQQDDMTASNEETSTTRDNLLTEEEERELAELLSDSE
ncbi:WD40-repeat-containing domain protein [Syncephalis plumigaleata]|nr:WD40-repeat-containing domain protein [Syncephalis plumigaleata]